MPRKALVVANLSPQQRLDYLIQSGAAAVVVKALGDPLAAEHWLNVQILAMASAVAPTCGLPHVAVRAYLQMVYEFGVVSGLVAGQKQVGRHFPTSTVDGVSAVLYWHLQQCLFGKVQIDTVTPVSIKPVPGRKTAIPVPKAQVWTEEERAVLLPVARERLSKGETIDEVATDMFIMSRTLRRYLAEDRGTQLLAVAGDAGCV